MALLHLVSSRPPPGARVSNFQTPHLGAYVSHCCVFARSSPRGTYVPHCWFSCWAVRFALLFFRRYVPHCCVFGFLGAHVSHCCVFCLSCHLGAYVSHCRVVRHLGEYVSHCCVFCFRNDSERTFRIAVFCVFPVFERTFRIAAFSFAGGGYWRSLLNNSLSGS